MNHILVYITAKNKMEAITIGTALVEERLAACVNVTENITSIYRWDDATNVDNESLLIAKTSSDKFQPLADRVKQLHSYTCPCIVSIPISGGNEEYLNWLGSKLQ